jgi:Fe-Mn family superoxide dismutase
MFTLPDLTYAKDALEPHIDAKTMEIHHDKHHRGYTDKLNKAIKDTHWENLSIEELLNRISETNTTIRNNGGGYYNHKLFWKILTPNGGGKPTGEIGDAIEHTFGSFDNFKKTFKEAALNRFGSGWAWLSVNKEGDLFISSTPNQDNPLMDIVDRNGIPVLGVDVWEHAYYLKYQNRRADYVDAFFHIINWKEVNERFQDAKVKAESMTT